MHQADCDMNIRRIIFVYDDYDVEYACLNCYEASALETNVSRLNIIEYQCVNIATLINMLIKLWN